MTEEETTTLVVEFRESLKKAQAAADDEDWEVFGGAMNEAADVILTMAQECDGVIGELARELTEFANGVGGTRWYV